MDNKLEKKKFFSKENWHYLILLYVIIYFSIFLWLEERNVNPIYIIDFSWDDYIPFVKEFIIPYVLWYVYWAGTVLYFLIKSKKDFIRYGIMLIGCTLSCFLIYYLFPTGINLRQEVTGTDIFSRIILYIRGIDEPNNVCPSLHVITSLVISAVIYKSDLFKNKVWVKITSTILAVLIIMSTCFLKQHSVIDIFAAIPIFIIFYLIAYKIKWRFVQN